MLTLSRRFDIITEVSDRGSLKTNYEMQEWRNWQTRRLQVPVVAISCGFKSRFLHFFYAQMRSHFGQERDQAGLAREVVVPQKLDGSIGAFFV